MKNCLLIIDVQRDFCEGGALPARDTTSLIQPLNKLISWSIERCLPCVFTRDWHPPDHCSFNTQGGPWPQHCIQGSYGAEFAEGLLVPNSSLVIDIEKDSHKANMSYSAFENTSLERNLRHLKITQIIATGIATDYCVRATVLDGLRCGFGVEVLTDLIRPIDLMVGDSARAEKEMMHAGANLSTSAKWMSSF